MGKHSNLGPVDPQINGIPAYAVVDGITKAYKEIVAEPTKAVVWNPILSRYHAGFVQQCDWAIQVSKEMVENFLKENMLSNLSESERDKAASQIVERLTTLSSNQGHDKHFHFDECQAMGLVVKSLEDPSDRKLQDLILTVHHCYMNTLSNTAAYKIIENHLGRRFVKIQVTKQLIVQQNPPIS